MIKKSCKDCYYGEVCYAREVCDDYFPVGEEAEDVVIEETIETGRSDFYSEWFRYIEYSDVLD